MAAADSGLSFSSSSSPCPGALFFPCSTFKSWMRNELPAKHLLQPIPALPLAEKRKSRQATSSVARRWHVARAVPFLLQPDEKRKIYPIEQGLSRWAGCARCPVRPIFIPLSHFLPRVFSSVLFHLCLAPSNVEMGSRWLLPIPACLSHLPLLPAPGHRFFLAQSFGRACLRRLRRSLPFQRERKK